jgi:hypothetical protein
MRSTGRLSKNIVSIGAAMLSGGPVSELKTGKLGEIRSRGWEG